MENNTGKKDVIIKIAFDYFLNVGYEATTVRMVCKKANIEPPSLYYYFGSKKGLFFAVVDKMLVDYQEMGQINSKEGSMHPEKLLEAIYENRIKYAITHKNETKFYLRYTLFTPPELKKDIETYMTPTYERKKTLFKKYLTQLCEMQEYKFNIETAFVMFERLVDDSTFNVVFSNWNPSKKEISEIFGIFCKLHYKGISLADKD